MRREGVGSGRLAVYASAEMPRQRRRSATDLLGIGTRAARVDRGGPTPADAHRRAARGDRRDVRAGRDADRRRWQRGHHRHRGDRPAGGDRRHLRRARPVAARRCGLRRGGVLAPELRPLFDGIERADSIAFDPHKWLYTPQSSACLLVRDPGLLGPAFAGSAAYVREDPSLSGTGSQHRRAGPAVVAVVHGAQGLDVAGGARPRRVRAADRARRRAGALPRRRGGPARRSSSRPAPVALSIACFRYVPADLPDGDGREAYLDLLNERLMTEIRLDGRSFPSNAEIDGRYVLRACIVNFRTEADDLDRCSTPPSQLGRTPRRRAAPAAPGGVMDATAAFAGRRPRTAWCSSCGSSTG